MYFNFVCTSGASIRRIMESPSTLIGNMGPSPAGHRPGPPVGSQAHLPPRPPLPAHSAPHLGLASPQRRRPPPLNQGADAPSAPAGGGGGAVPAAHPQHDAHPQQQEEAGGGGRALSRVWEADGPTAEEVSSAAIREELQRSRADVRKLQARL